MRLRARIEKRSKELQLETERQAPSLAETVFSIVDDALEGGDPVLRAEIVRRELNQVLRESKQGTERSTNVILNLQDRVSKQNNELRSLRAWKSIALTKLPEERLRTMATMTDHDLVRVNAQLEAEQLRRRLATGVDVQDQIVDRKRA